MKHKDEIIRWANCQDGTKVWVKEPERDWELANIAFWHRDALYIVDDEYAELRKAQCDGKTIQWLNSDIKWISLDKPDYNFPVEYYRIKPAVKFKTGTFVRVQGCPQLIEEGMDTWYTDEDTGVELWYPEVRDWCWFTNHRELVKVYKVEYGYIYGNNLHGKGFCSELKHCEAFIGELPSFIWKKHD